MLSTSSVLQLSSRQGIIRPMKYTPEIARDIMDYWNSKGIVVHKRFTSDMERALKKVMRDGFEIEEIKALIDFYATILEPTVKEDEKKYFWSYRWNLFEFLMRGVPKFDGQDPSNYLKKQRVDTPEVVVIKRTL